MWKTILKFFGREEEVHYPPSQFVLQHFPSAECIHYPSDGKPYSIVAEHVAICSGVSEADAWLRTEAFLKSR